MLVMKRKRIILALAACLGCGALGPAARAADAPVQLKPMPAITKDIAAFPRLVAAPDDKATPRINRAFDKLDASARQMQKDCLANVDKPSDADYSRTIWVTMQGPRYLSFLVSDSFDCGGAHPDGSQMALVYDLASGAPVNWQRLLPKAMVQGTSTDTAGDGTVVGFVTSKTLQSLWLKVEAAASPIDPDCKDADTDPKLTLTLYPDAKADGLAVEPGDFPHVIAACADTNVIPTATLRPLGVDAGLLDAIDAAHAGGFFDKDLPE
jgi:hypothetical protein